MKDSPDEIFSWRDWRDTYTDEPPAWSVGSDALALFTLDHFVGEAGPVDLSDCALRRLTEDDLQSIRQALDEKRPLSLSGLFSGHSEWDDFRGEPMPWVLEVPLPAGPFDAAIRAANLISHKFESALRLLAIRPNLHVPLVYQPGVRQAVTGLFHLKPAHPSWAERSGAKPLTLDAGKSIELRELYERQQTVTDPRVRLAIRRFNLAYQRDLPDDSLVDAWIGLEAMFSEGASDIRFKASMRVAYYLDSRKGKDRPKIFNELNDSYGVRNNLVHGTPKKLDTSAASRAAITGLALALRRALRSGAAPDLTALNQLIAQGIEGSP